MLDRVRECCRVKHYTYRTEQTYCVWIRRFILFNSKRHPREMGKPEVEMFLTHLAVRRNVAPSTQNEVRAVLAGIEGRPRLVVQLIYGSGLRLMEALRLRVKDVDFGRKEVIVRDGKGGKDRRTMLPVSLVEPLRAEVERVETFLCKDRIDGLAPVQLPYALERKYPRAGTTLGWQFLFPAKTTSLDPRSGIGRRHHLHETAVQRAIRRAVLQSGIGNPATSHTFRYSFATYLIESGYDIRTAQELSGHRDIRTTRISTHVQTRHGRGVLSPLGR